MKSSKIVLTALALGAILLSSCSKSNKDMIVGTWKVADMKIQGFDISALPAEQKAVVEAQMKEMKEKSSFEAKADGSFHQVNWAGQEYKQDGTWKFTEDGKSLILTSGAKADTFNVTLSDSKMEWDSKGNKISYDKK